MVLNSDNKSFTAKQMKDKWKRCLSIYKQLADYCNRTGSPGLAEIDDDQWQMLGGDKEGVTREMYDLIDSLLEDGQTSIQ